MNQLSSWFTLYNDPKWSRFEPEARRLRFDVETPSGPIRADTSLVGDFNVDNLLAAIASAQCAGLDGEEIEHGLRQVRQVPGRFEAVDEGQPFLVLVDYAHTEDALRRLITAAQCLAEHGRVLTLFGCGGDRDRSKRAPMGRVAGELSDVAVLTSDNPRTEDPMRIIDDAARGLREGSAAWTAVPDRKEAIAATLSTARTGDVVLIAGKGHETTQTLGNGAIDFDDRLAARAALREMGYSKP